MMLQCPRSLVLTRCLRKSGVYIPAYPALALSKHHEHSSHGILEDFGRLTQEEAMDILVRGLERRSDNTNKQGPAYKIHGLPSPPTMVLPVVQSIWSEVLRQYAGCTPTALSVVRDVVFDPTSLVPAAADLRRVAQSEPARVDPSSLNPEFQGDVYHDHFAFRTFGVPGLGIVSLAQTLQQIGYEQQGDLFEFPGKKLLATWFAPRDKALYDPGLPRVFVSEVQVEKLSDRAQCIIRRHTSSFSAVSSPSSVAPHSPLAPLSGGTTLTPAMVLGAILTRTLPWASPSEADYRELHQESEYAAWVLAHGYALNHTALSVHRLLKTSGRGPPEGPSSRPSGTKRCWSLLEFSEKASAAGIVLNREGGVIKVSPDGLLLQSSTLSDPVRYKFSCGAEADIAGSYIEFVERRPLPLDLKSEEDLLETDRRDGFEVDNADKIFQSTALS